MIFFSLILRFVEFKLTNTFPVYTFHMSGLCIKDRLCQCQSYSGSEVPLQ